MLGILKGVFGWIKGIVLAGQILKNLAKIKNAIKEAKEAFKQFRETMDQIKKAKADGKWSEKEISKAFDNAEKLANEVIDVFEVFD